NNPAYEINTRLEFRRGLRRLVNNENDYGTWQVRVNNPGGQSSNWESFTVTAAAPTISSLSPSSMPGSNSDQQLTINGSNFQSGATLTFDPPPGPNIPSNAGKPTCLASSRIPYQDRQT